MNCEYIPMTKKEMTAAGVDRPDFVLVTGDAYVDHPTFANALVARYLVSLGYSVGIIAQPDYKNPDSVKVFGEPKLAFLVSAGNLDSMVNAYTANKAPRSKDAYSPGGKLLRPKRATIVYCNLISRAYPHSPKIIGGIEASLRRFAHYDYWDDNVRSSILEDSGADILIYGMGERQLQELAEGLASGISIKDLTYVRGTCYMASDFEHVYEDCIIIPPHSEVATGKRKYALAFAQQLKEQDHISGKVVIQRQSGRYLIQNPPAEPLSRVEMDYLYTLPFKREAHPSYKEEIAALEEVKFSVICSRGCFGACAFCAITFHQGKHIVSRSIRSMEDEVREFTKHKDFKGYVHDVGGPTANFMQNPCEKSKEQGYCTQRRCLSPKPCPNLQATHSEYISVLERLRKIPGVKKVFVRSGLRYDYILADKKANDVVKQIATFHTSGRLKVAPEHCSKDVLRVMGKPDISVYTDFCKRFEMSSKKYGLKQFVLPYFISSHPGAKLSDAIELALFLKKSGYVPDQVQDFYPTPGSVSTTMYHSGLNPFTMQPVYVPRADEMRKMQRALLQFNKPQNHNLVKKALLAANRKDLIGNGIDCLIRG